MASILQGREQGHCEPQCWTGAVAERVARAQYFGRSMVQPLPNNKSSLLERDRASGSIRVMFSRDVTLEYNALFVWRCKSGRGLVLARVQAVIRGSGLFLVYYFVTLLSGD